jgi:bacterioferritin-associated ferredoxin
MIVCLCLAVSERAVHAAIESGATTLDAVRATCGAGAGCGGCLPTVAEMLRRPGAVARVAGASPYLAAVGAAP